MLLLPNVHHRLSRCSGRPGSSESRKERGQGECGWESADSECTILPPPTPQRCLQLHVQTIQLNLGSKDAKSQVKGCNSAGYSHLRSTAQKRKWNPGSSQEFSTHNLLCVMFIYKNDEQALHNYAIFKVTLSYLLILLVRAIRSSIKRGVFYSLQTCQLNKKIHFLFHCLF